jgi:hypothetical protein
VEAQVPPWQIIAGTSTMVSSSARFAWINARRSPVVSVPSAVSCCSQTGSAVGDRRRLAGHASRRRDGLMPVTLRLIGVNEVGSQVSRETGLDSVR